MASLNGYLQTRLETVYTVPGEFGTVPNKRDRTKQAGPYRTSGTVPNKRDRTKQAEPYQTSGTVPNKRNRSEQAGPYRTSGTVPNKRDRTEQTGPYRTSGTVQISVGFRIRRRCKRGLSFLTIVCYV